MSDQSEALHWLRSKDFDLAKKMEPNPEATAKEFIAEFRLVLSILEGHPEKIKPGTQCDAELMAIFMSMEQSEIDESIAEIKQESSLLNEFLTMLKPDTNKSVKKAERVLTESEIRYVMTEGVPPLEFLEKKYQSRQ